MKVQLYRRAIAFCFTIAIIWYAYVYLFQQRSGCEYLVAVGYRDQLKIYLIFAALANLVGLLFLFHRTRTTYVAALVSVAADVGLGLYFAVAYIVSPKPIGVPHGSDVARKEAALDLVVLSVPVIVVGALAFVAIILLKRSLGYSWEVQEWVPSPPTREAEVPSQAEPLPPLNDGSEPEMPYYFAREKDKDGVAILRPIRDREDAIAIINGCAVGFMIVGIVQGVIGIFLATSLLVDAVLFFLSGGALLAFKSRVAAVMLLLISGLAAISTVLNLIGTTSAGGRNVFLAAIILVASVRALEATFRWHGTFKHDLGVRIMEVDELDLPDGPESPFWNRRNPLGTIEQPQDSSLMRPPPMTGQSEDSESKTCTDHLADLKAEGQFHPRITRILAYDTLSKLLVIMPATFWGIAIVTGVFGMTIVRRGSRMGPEEGSFFFALAAVGTAIALPLLFLRIRSIQQLFRRATFVQGTVFKVTLAEKNGLMEFNYRYLDEEYSSSAGVSKRMVAEGFDEGRELELAVDPNKPKRALVVEFYT